MTKEEAIKHLHTYSSTNGSGLTTQDQHEEAKKMAIKALETQPGWIPVTERLPTENNSYLVWMPFAPEGHHITVAEWCGSYWNIKTPITAWMPLPAPYIPEGDDKHEG